MLERIPRTLWAQDWQATHKQCYEYNLIRLFVSVHAAVVVNPAGTIAVFVFVVADVVIITGFVLVIFVVVVLVLVIFCCKLDSSMGVKS